jgi:hypothetical protein
LEKTPQATIQSLDILEESVRVKNFRATCPCGRVFTHRDRRTLETNIDRHLARYHGAQNEWRLKLEEVQRKIRQIRNRMYGT